MSAEETLSQIVESAGFLLKLVEDEQPIAEREVRMLQTALDFVLASNNDLNKTKKAQQCKNVIERLAHYTRSAPDAKTGDTEDVKPLGFDEHGAPTQKATTYIVKTVALIEKKTNLGAAGAGKGKKGQPEKDGEAAETKPADKDHNSAQSASSNHSSPPAAATNSFPATSSAAASASQGTSPAVASTALSPSLGFVVSKNKKKKKKTLALQTCYTLKPQQPIRLPSPLDSGVEDNGDAESDVVGDGSHPEAGDSDVDNYDANAEDSTPPPVKKQRPTTKVSKSMAAAAPTVSPAAADANDFILNASLAADSEYEEELKRMKELRILGAKGPSAGSAQQSKPNKVAQLLEPILGKVGKQKQQQTTSNSSNGNNKSGGNAQHKRKKHITSVSNNASPNSSFNLGKSGDRLAVHGSKQQQQWRWTNIPLQRRLQTLVVSILTFFTGLPFFVALFFVLCFFKYTLPFMIIYLIYIFIIFPKTSKWPLKGSKWWCQLWIFDLYRDYFPIRLVVPKSIRRLFDPKENYFFIYHPHGIHSFGAVVCFGADVHGVDKMLPGIKFHVQTLGVQFWVPFWRELVVWFGSGDASAKCIKQTLAAGPGESPVLVVGGAEESLLSSPKTNVLCLMKRKGFVRIALEMGKPLVPVFAFGETNVYYNYAHHIPSLRNFLLQMQKKTKFALPIIVGRGYFNYSFGMLPHRRPINVVIGEPLVVPHIPKPTPEEVDYWHAQYVEALKAHYEKHKGVYDPEGSLVIS